MALNDCPLLKPDWVSISADATWGWLTIFAATVIGIFWICGAGKGKGAFSTWVRRDWGLRVLSLAYVTYLVYVLIFLSYCYGDEDGFHSKHVLVEAIVVTGAYIFACVHVWNAMNNAISVTTFCVIWMLWSAGFAALTGDQTLFSAGGSIVTVGGVMLGLKNREQPDERWRSNCALILTVVGTLLWGYGDRFWAAFK